MKLNNGGERDTLDQQCTKKVSSHQDFDLTERTVHDKYVSQESQKNLILDKDEEEEEEEANMHYTNEEKLKLQNIANLMAGKKQKNISDIYKKEEKGSPAVKHMKSFNKEEGIFEFHNKICVYDARSFYLFYHKSRFRRAVVWFIEWKWFERAITLIIVVNSLFLPFYNYQDRNNLTRHNQIIETAGLVFTGIFTVEALLKMTAMGFIMHNRAYLRNGWNWIDFLVVIIGLLDSMPNLQAANLKALRTMRVVRPLKSINSIPSMRRLISSLLGSLPALANAAAFLLFFFMLFDILGVQQFVGYFYYKCRLTPLPVFDLDVWPIDTSVTQQCNVNNPNSCPAGDVCGSPNQYNISLANENVSNDPVINYGMQTFDNVGYGLITLFQCITLENWTLVMYNMMDANSEWLSPIFFVLFSIVGGVFLLNVILAIIMDAFDDVDQKQADADARKKQANNQALQKQKLRESKNKSPNKKEPSNFEQRTLTIKEFTDDQQSARGMLSSSVSNSIHLPNEKAESEGIGEGRSGTPSKHRVTLFFYQVSMNSFFSSLIILLIIANTVILALDRYPIDPDESQVLNVLNQIFSWFFFTEMLIKLVGLGPKTYIKDTFNLFDCSVVILSTVELGISWAGVNLTGGAISALRSLRILRIFKLARSWTSFRDLLGKIVMSIKDITNFSILMCLFMFIYTLLGMELYAYRIQFDSAFNPVEPGDPNGTSPRENFDYFLMGLNTVFQVIIGDNWPNFMYNFTRCTNWGAAGFFIALIIFGHIILLSLFLAILLKNFEEDESQQKLVEESKLSKSEKLKTIFIQKAGWIKTVFCCLCFSQKNQVREEDGIGVVVVVGDKVLAPNGGNSQEEENSRFLDKVTPRLSEEQLQASDPKDRTEKRLRFREQQSETAVNIQLFGSILQDPMYQTQTKLQDFNTHMEDDEGDDSQKLKKSRTMNDSTRFGSPSKFSLQVQKKKEHADSQSQFSLDQQNKKKISIAEKRITQIIQKKKSKQQELIDRLQGRSLYLMERQNAFRVKCAYVVGHRYFENLILFVIFLSSILLSVDNPLDNPNGRKQAILHYFDIVLTTIFTVECVSKIIVFGFILNYSDSYLRNGWNIMDISIVIISIVSLAAANVHLKFFKALRLLRILRPLRVISRNENLKIAVQSLLNSIPGVVNVMIITLLFLILFGILGVNFFKGRLFYCAMNNVDPTLQSLVWFKWDCLNSGGEWVNSDNNFDNILNSLVALFNAMSQEGWAAIMYSGTDVVDYNVNPQPYYRQFIMIYFFLFMIVCNLFVLNLFVGVVINTFNLEQERLGGGFLLTPTQKEWVLLQIMSYKIKPGRKFQSSGSRFRDLCIKTAENIWFDRVIIACIILNTVVLALKWYNQSAAISTITEKFNYAFTAIFASEAIIKICAFRSAYFKEGWNIFDFIIVVGTFIGIIIGQVSNVNVGPQTTVIRAFRIGRVLRIIRKYRSLRKIFNTFVVAIPSLANVGGLLFLLLYLYSILGIYLFAGVQLQDNLNDHANFQTFGYALLTLIRCTTGESWNLIMFDCGRQFSILFQCVYNQDYDSIEAQGVMGCGNRAASVIYFFSFILFIAFIFLNMFVAIILEGFSNSSDDEDMRVQEETLLKFRQIWMNYDPSGEGFIDVHQFEQFILDLVDEELKERDKLIEDNSEKVEENQLVDGEHILFDLHKNEMLEFNGQNRHQVQECVKEQSGLTETEIRRQMQRNMKHYIASLHLPTYKNIHCYNFYDILEELSKNVFDNDFKARNRDRQEELLTENRTMSKLQQEIERETYLTSFDDVIESLEAKAEKNHISKYDQLQAIRKKQIHKNKSRLDTFQGNQIIDSAFVAHGAIIQAYVKNWIELNRKKKEQPREVVALHLEIDLNKDLSEQVCVDSEQQDNEPSPSLPLPQIHQNSQSKIKPSQEMITIKKNISKVITDKILEASRPFTPTRIQTAALFSEETKNKILRFNGGGGGLINQIVEEAKEHDYTTNKDSSYHKGVMNFEGDDSSLGSYSSNRDKYKANRQWHSLYRGGDNGLNQQNTFKQEKPHFDQSIEFTVEELQDQVFGIGAADHHLFGRNRVVPGLQDYDQYVSSPIQSRQVQTRGLFFNSMAVTKEEIGDVIIQLDGKRKSKKKEGKKKGGVQGRSNSLKKKKM